MNAVLPVPRMRPRLSKLEDTILWICVKHPPVNRGGISRILGVTASTISQSMNRLVHLGYIDRGRGSCIPRPAALNHVSQLSADEMTKALRLRSLPPPRQEPRGSNSPVVAQADHLTAAAGRAEEVAPLFGTGMAATGDIVAVLASHQDPLLAAANARLQRRVLELEAEVQDLKDQRAKALQRLGFVCDALSG